MCKAAVVDGEQDNLDVFKLLFREIERDYKIKIVAYFILQDARQCSEEMIIEIDPDIVFIDIKIPGLSGIEVLDKLRTLGYNKPIIAQTASVTTFEIEIYQEIFSDGILKKPVDKEQLVIFFTKFGFLNTKS